jgi:predicted DNA binding CopG/RHH family protein
MSRNDAFAALLAIGAQIEPGAPGSAWGEHGRKMKPPEKAQMPALFQIEGDSEAESKLGQLIKRKQQVLWVIIQNTGKDQSVEPAINSADLIDRVEAKFGDKGLSYQTLSGNVYAAYIDGAIRRYPGDIDGIEMITVPISVLLP